MTCTYICTVYLQDSEITVTLTVTVQANQHSKNKQSPQNLVVSGFVIYGSHAVPKGHKPFI